MSTPNANPILQRQRRSYLLLLIVLATIASLLINISTGSFHFAFQDYLNVLLGDRQLASYQIITELRLPRALIAFACGGLLALAGTLMQVLLRNPLADPYVLGISGGAAVFALLAMLAGLSSWLVNGSAFAGAMLAMLLVFSLARGQGSWTTTRLLLTGVVMASAWGAMISFILSISPEQQLRGMLFWLMGDLSLASQPRLTLFILLLGLFLSLLLSRHLNVLQLGDQQASLLGIQVKRLRWQIYILASLLTAIAVNQAGTIAFVGLVVPHLLRLSGLTDHRFLLPAAVLTGGSLLLLSDSLLRSLLDTTQVPIGVMTAAIGVPVFLYLLYRGKQ